MAVPKLRFKADDGSQFPEWEEKKLGEYLIQYTEKTTVNNQYPVLTSSRKGIYLQDDYYGRQVASENNIGYNIVPYGYFTYRHMSDDLIFRFNINNIVEKGIVSTLYPVFTVTDKIDSNFLQSYLNESIDFFKYCMLQKQGGSRTYMYFGKLKDFVAHLPCLPEQQKIAEFLSTIDTVIAKQKETVSAWEERKKGVMQKLFSQEVRFKADDGSEFPEWEKKPFGDIVSEFKVKTKVENEDTLLSCAINGVFLNSELFGHQRGQSNIGYLKIKKETLILSAQNLHLGNANVNLRFEHGIISPAYKTYDIVGCSAEYMSQWVKWDMTKQFFYNATTVGASECRRNVDWNMLYSQLFAVPCLAEQQKIADFLSSLDEVIEKQKATLAAWEELKKGLLQQMFV